jgi:4-alpha-glucanotransferase
VASTYLNHTQERSENAAWDLLTLAWSSKAGLAIAPLQDLLNLGSQGRMNLPGTAEGNWRWRCTEEMLTPSVFERLRELTLASDRRVGFEKRNQAETVETAP